MDSYVADQNVLLPWKIYYKPAGSDDERVYLITLNTQTVSEALDFAAQYYGYPAHDLVASSD